MTDRPTELREALDEGDSWLAHERPDPGTVAQAQACYTKAVALALIALADPAPSSEGGLDVERLTRAIAVVENESPDDGDAGRRAFAVLIAAEYARPEGERSEGTFYGAGQGNEL